MLPQGGRACLRVTQHNPNAVALVRRAHFWRCLYCGSSRRVTLDHVVPWVDGGRNFANLVAACSSCNTSKGRLSVLEFLRKRRDLSPHDIIRRAAEVQKNAETIRYILPSQRSSLVLACQTVAGVAEQFLVECRRP